MARQVRLDDDVVDLLEQTVEVRGGVSLPRAANAVLRRALTHDVTSHEDAATPQERTQAASRARVSNGGRTIRRRIVSPGQPHGSTTIR